MRFTCRVLAAVSAIAAAALVQVSSAAAAGGMQICYDGATHWYTGEIYSLIVNGNEINAAMEPIIFNDHALVPVREIFEECGAIVDYTMETQCVEIQYNDSYIRMYINDNYAYVNGKKQEIPDNVVPKLINKPGGETKTMVPVRFISETAGMDVEFDGDNGEIIITSNEAEDVPVRVEETEEPAPTEEPVQETPVETETPVSVVSTNYKMLSDTSMKITVECDGSVAGRYSAFTLTDPERVVVDFAYMGLSEGEQTINVGTDGISSIRTGHNDERARIVVDVEELVDYSVEAVSDNAVEIIVEVSGNTSAPAATEPPKTDIGSSAPTNTVTPSYTEGITPATAADSQKIIMLDAGHGGSDPGAIGTLNGTQINEKDLTLSITYKVKAILEANGYKTSMTRTGDTLPSLTERPAQANAENCALFVSIHINSAEATSAYGTEVYYSEENNGDTYGVTSQAFAENVLKGMISNMGSYNRGVKMANWAVIRRSNMPAILLEVGFISNQAELANMCSDDYQNKVAKGIAEGIINTVHSVNVPSGNIQ